MDNFNSNTNTILVVLKKSFIELLPYMVIMSILIVSIQLITIFHIDAKALQNDLIAFTEATHKLLPFLLITAISVNFARKNKFNISMSILASLISYALYNTLRNDLKFELDNILTLNTFAMPFVTIYTMMLLYKIDFLRTQILASSLLRDALSLLMPFVISILATSILFYYLNLGLESYAGSISTYIARLPEHIFLFFYEFFSGLFWFIGVHGVTAAALFFDTSIMENDIFPHISNSNFMNLFTVFGGAGAGLSLALAILIDGRNAHWKKISKFSLPFVVFNINEILIFGLPIVFNRYLFLPFVFVPLINFILAYGILSSGIIVFSMQDVHWAMPIFINTFLATNGNISALLLQAFLLMVSILVYLPFIRLYSNSQDRSLAWDRLQTNLNIQEKFDTDFMAAEKSDEQLNLLKKNIKINKTIGIIHESQLLLHYQPKIETKTEKCIGLEALLRIKLKNGEIRGPFFLGDLEEGKLIKIIDLWVVRKVKEQMLAWQREGFTPSIDINLHPDTLGDTAIIEEIISLFGEEKMRFEIVERSLLGNKAKENIKKLHSHGHMFSIDDFGVGYTSILTLKEKFISRVKIDKSLIDTLGDEKTMQIVTQLSVMCSNLGLDMVAEGVETREQVTLVRKVAIKYIQGFYYSKAISPEQVKAFCDRSLVT